MVEAFLSVCGMSLRTSTSLPRCLLVALKKSIEMDMVDSPQPHCEDLAEATLDME